MTPKDLKKTPSQLLQRLETYYWVHDILRVNVGVPVWLILWDGKKSLEWRDLSQVLPPLMPYHFELRFERESERDAYYLRMLKKAATAARPQFGSLFGFDDLFAPVAPLADGGWAFVYVGQFMRQEPNYESLARSWREVSGRESANQDPDFQRFVEVSLSLKVIEEVPSQALIQLAEAMAAHLRGDAPAPEGLVRLDRLRREVLSPHLGHPIFAQQAIGNDALRPTPWHGIREMAQWMQEETGLSRLPTTVIAMCALNDRSAPLLDPVRRRLRDYQLQRSCLRVCREMDEVMAEPLETDGVLFLTSPKPGASASAARQQLRDKVEALRAFVRQSFGLRSAFGVGMPVPSGERLKDSSRQAVSSLYYALQVEKETLFFDEMESAPIAFRYASLADAASELGAVFEEGTPEVLRLAMDEYVRLTLEFSKNRLDVARGQFLGMLYQLLSAMRRRSTVPESDARRLVGELSLHLEGASALYPLIERFKESLRRMGHLARAGQEGAKSLRMQSTLAWLRENYSRGISLTQAAKHAGLSVPGFTRSFRQVTGMAFLPYLRNLRVEQAKRLLRNTTYSVLEIAQLCGFSSSHHFIRAFKQVSKDTPQNYRRKIAGAHKAI